MLQSLILGALPPGLSLTGRLQIGGLYRVIRRWEV
jgi:hypothetical protein